MPDSSQFTECPHCGLNLENDGTYSGQLVACPSCLQQFVMPNSSVMCKQRLQASTPSQILVVAAKSRDSRHTNDRTPTYRTSRLAAKSLIIGLFSIICFPLGVVSIAFGIAAILLAKNRAQGGGRSLALAGIGLGTLGVAIPVAISLVSPERVVPNSQQDVIHSAIWQNVDASGEARKETWKLICQREERKVAETESERVGVAPPRIVQTDKSHFSVEYLGNQLYRVNGEYSEQMSIGVRGAFGDPKFRTRLERKSFRSVVCQVAKGEWKFVEFESQQLPAEASKGMEGAMIPGELKFGLSESQRKEFFREYVLVEDRFGVNSAKSQTAKRQLCNSYKVTERQALDICVEAYEKDWPTPSSP